MQIKQHTKIDNGKTGNIAKIAIYIDKQSALWQCVIRLVGHWQLPIFIGVMLAFCKSKLPRTRNLIECSAAREGRVVMAGVACHRDSTNRNLNRDKTMLVVALEDQANIA